MTDMIFTVKESSTGWFVGESGPFFSRERATDLAEGMAAALRSFGTGAKVVVHEAPTRGAVLWLGH